MVFKFFCHLVVFFSLSLMKMLMEHNAGHASIPSFAVWLVMIYCACQMFSFAIAIWKQENNMTDTE